MNRKFRKNLLLVPVAFILSSCGYALISTTPEVSPTVTGLSASNLYGQSFTAGCAVVSGADQISTLVFNAGGTDSTLTITSYESSDGSCTTEANVIIINFNSLSFGSRDDSTGRMDYNNRAGTSSLMPSSVGMATIFNGLNAGAGLCNINTWAANVTEDISGCFISVGYHSYGSLWLEGTVGSLTLTTDSSADAAGCGANDNSSVGLRCTTKSVDTASIFL